MDNNTTQRQRNKQQIGNWLLLGIGMTIVQIALGGITRLTGSGLSITEWDVVTGSLPPLNQSAWLAEFEKYQATPQYRLLNSNFSLANFKFIFFWEWFHRLWARLIGLVFAAGFLYFLGSKKFEKSMVWPLVLLFALGGMQGAIGWIMVASGLEGDAIYVKPTRLALHFVFALGLLCYTFWFAMQLRLPVHKHLANKALYRFAGLVLALLVVQLGYGALMAGHKAASVAATWPSINGYLLYPPGSYNPQAGWLSLVNNPVMVHVVHRGLAYIIALLVMVLTWQLHKQAAAKRMGWPAYAPLALVVAQVALGIATVLFSPYIVANQWGAFEWMAQLHQLTGMLLLLSLVYLLFATKPQAASIGVPERGQLAVVDEAV
jgi:cytochrome c oxidase assembly protein subunit 15